MIINEQAIEKATDDVMDALKHGLPSNSAAHLAVESYLQYVSADAVVINDNQPGKTAIIELCGETPTLPVGARLILI